MSKTKFTLPKLLIVGIVLVIPSLFSDVFTQAPIISDLSVKLPAILFQSLGSAVIGFCAFELLKRLLQDGGKVVHKYLSALMEGNSLVIAGVILIGIPAALEVFLPASSVVKWIISFLSGFIVGLWFAVLDLTPPKAKEESSEAVAGIRVEDTNLIGKENVLAILSIHREEWKHRDNMFISMFWRFIYISLIVTFLPNFIQRLGFLGNALLELPIWVFSAAGIVCALFGMYLGISEAARMKAADMTYQRIMAELPARYRPTPLTDLGYKKPITLRMNAVLCVGVYSTIIALAVANIFYSLV